MLGFASLACDPAGDSSKAAGAEAKDGKEAANAKQPEAAKDELPALPAGDPRYEIRVGPTVSAQDPELVDYVDPLPPGIVGIAFRMVGAGNFVGSRS